MLKRLSAAAALLLFIHSGAVAQTMRFSTSAGSFDMVLNPNHDPNLQALVDNLVAYVGLGRYHFTAVNRASDAGPGTADDFVLQMGGFQAFPPVPELWARTLTPVDALMPVTVDADNDGTVDFSHITNDRGTVSLALQSGNPNSGTSSFFINLGDNSFLDSQGFVPFARIENMATVDKIMQLMQTDLSDDVGQNGNLALTDVPLQPNGRLVVVNDVQVVQAPQDFSFCGPIATALQLANRNNGAAGATAQSLTSASDLASAALLAERVLLPSDSAAVGAASSASAVPEPTTIGLGLSAVIASLLAARRPNRHLR